MRRMPSPICARRCVWAAGMMSQDFLDWTKALLALDVKALGRGDEATIIVAPLCHAAGLDARTQAVIAQGHLCD